VKGGSERGWTEAFQGGFIADFGWEREYIAVDNYVPFLNKVYLYISYFLKIFKKH